MDAAAAVLISAALFLLLAYGVRMRALRPSEARVRSLSPRLDQADRADEGLRRLATILSRMSEATAWLTQSTPTAGTRPPSVEGSRCCTTTIPKSSPPSAAAADIWV